MDIKEYISSGIIEAYVMGLATEEEVSILMCIRKHNTEVEQAIVEAQKTLEDFATVHAVPPSSDLKAAIWNTLSEQSITTGSGIPETQDSTQASPPTTSAAPIRSLATRNIAIAASILLALSLGANAFLHYKNEANQEVLARTLAEQQSTQLTLETLKEKWSMLQNPAIKTITLAGVAQHPDLKAHVFWNTQTTDVYLSLENLPAAPEGMQYQLWAIVDGKPVDAGVFPLDQTDRINNMRQIPKAQAFAVTLETKGGNPTPNLAQLYVMGNI